MKTLNLIHGQMKKGIYHNRITTLVGTLEGQRIFEKTSYSYNITKCMLESVDDFEVVNCLMDRCQVETTWKKYHQWSEALGEVGFPYCQLPYSGLGYLISLHFGVEKTSLEMYDNPDQVRKLIDTVNDCNLRILDTIVDGPAEVFGAMGTDAEFEECVKHWLDTRHVSPRLIMAAGDQVPTDAPLHRIEMLPDLVEKYERY
jgi:hypothetical protein